MFIYLCVYIEKLFYYLYLQRINFSFSIFEINIERSFKYFKCLMTCKPIVYISIECCY